MPARLTLLPKPPLDQAYRDAADGLDDVLTALEHAMEFLDERNARITPNGRDTVRRMRTNAARHDALRLKAQLEALARTTHS